MLSFVAGIMVTLALIELLPSTLEVGYNLAFSCCFCVLVSQVCERRAVWFECHVSSHRVLRRR
jgi:hypothetical protein